MSGEPEADREARLDAAMVERQEAIDSGDAFDEAEWLRRHADLAGKLGAFLEDEGRLISGVTAALPLAGGRFGPYRLEEPLGRGSTGLVFRAVDQRTGCEVALKLLMGSLLDPMDAAATARFEGKARLIEGLSHPGIVPLIDWGVEAGVPYVAMPRIDGSDLSRAVREARSGGASPLGRDCPGRWKLIAEIGGQLARGLALAHENGVVHRDIKPSNLMVDREGRARLTDFDLARKAEGGAATATHESPGTYRYMAPETLEGGSGRRVDLYLVDVYALGLTLYELVALRPAFEGAGTIELIRDIRRKSPPRLSRLEPGVPRDLERIIRKAIEREPEDRYSTAEALASDLERFAAGGRFRVARVPVWRRVRSWARRHPSWALTGVAAAFGAMLAVAVLQSLTASEARYGQLLLEIQGSGDDRRVAGWSERGQKLVEEAARIHRDARLRDQAAGLMLGYDAHGGSPDRRYGGSSVAMDDRTGRVLLGGHEPYREQDGRARLLDRATWSELFVSEQSGPGPVTFDRGGRALQLVARAGELLLWDVEKGVEVARIEMEGVKSEPLALSEDGGRVAATTGEGVFVWGVGEGSGGPSRVAEEATALAFTPDGRWIASGDARGRVRVAKIEGESDGVELEGPPGEVHALAFGRDPRSAGRGGMPWRLAVGHNGGNLIVWDVPKEEGYQLRPGSLYDVTALAFAPDGMTLASGGRFDVILWDVATGRPILKMKGGDHHEGLAWSRDGDWLAVASDVWPEQQRATSGLWKLEAGRGLTRLRGLTAPVSVVVVSRDGRRIAALSHDWRVAVWDIGGPGCARLRSVLEGLRGDTADNAALAFSPDGLSLAGSAGREARVWDLETGEARVWPLKDGLVDALAYTSAESLHLFRAEREKEGERRRGVLREMLGPGSPRVVAMMPDFADRFEQAKAAPDGGTIAVQGSWQAEGRMELALAILDGRTGDVIGSGPPPEGEATSLGGFDTLGSLLVLYQELSGGRGPGTLLVEPRSGKVVGELGGIAERVGPGGKLWVAKIPGIGRYGEQEGGLILHRGFREELVRLGLGEPWMLGSPAITFDETGNLMAWGLISGDVIVADLREVNKRLRDEGLGGW